MAVSEDFIHFVRDRFKRIPEWEMRKMFGGVGIFRHNAMFAMISSSHKVYLRVNDDYIPRFEELGMTQFAHTMNTKANMPYYECPPQVLEDHEQLLIWTNRSYEIAVSAKKNKTKK